MDDLLDLNWTSSSAGKPPAAPALPGTASGSQNKAAGRAQSPASYSAFDSLASAGSGYGPNYTSSYSTQSSQPSRLSSTPVPAVRTPSPNPSVQSAGRQTTTSSTRDAFDSLFDNAGANGTKKASEKSMTLQDRMQAQSSGLGFSQPVNGKQTQLTSSDPWDFDLLSPATSSRPAAPSKAPTNRSSSPFDMFDDLERTSNNAQHVTPKPSTATKIQASASTAGTDDDILGLLGQPVAATKPPAQIVAPRPTRHKPADNTPSSASSSRPPSRPTAARTPSPPPHILGQVVSMGFSVQQARLALAATLGSEQPGQWNISGAMEILASDGAAHAARQRTEQDLPRKPFDNGREEDDEAYLRRQRDGRRARQESSNSRASGNRDQDRNGTISPNQSTLDVTANELLQQASVFGSSMLKSANAYWKTSRAQIQKAIDEKKLAIPIVSGPSSGRSSPSSARPRWMTEEVNEDDDSLHQTRASKKAQAVPSESMDTGFKDFDNDDGSRGGQADVLQAHPSDRRSERSQQKQRESQSIPSLQLDQAAAPCRAGHGHATSSQNGNMPRSATLLGIPQPEKRVYTSPNRRKVAASAPVSAVPPHSPTPPVSAKPKVSRPPRPRISATPSQLETSRKYRTLGNEHFKLGRYGEAVEAYNKASDALPEGHIAQVAVLNNRANARLKIGEERQASTDATAVLNILCAPTDLAKATREVWEVILHDFSTATQQDVQNEKFDAHDALGKALARRARGYEGCEKWRLAMMDWQMITELGDPAVVKSAGGMKVVSEGLHRCRKVVEGGNTTKPPAANAPKRPPPARPPKRAVSIKPVHPDAVDKLRETNKKAEADEAERLNVKDAVDAKITEWKGGKENNLRALIASLDNVLWDELGWKKVGMHELITDSQLKVRYVRAISKVHPDKIGPDVPIERRLIANAVFSTLSDAWNAHAK